MTDNLEQRIKHTLEMSKHKVFVEGYDDIIRELLGVIDSQREALLHIKEATKCKAHYDVAHKALTLSAPLQGWKEWGV